MRVWAGAGGCGSGPTSEGPDKGPGTLKKKRTNKKAGEDEKERCGDSLGLSVIVEFVASGYPWAQLRQNGRDGHSLREMREGDNGKICRAAAVGGASDAGWDERRGMAAPRDEFARKCLRSAQRGDFSSADAPGR